jgi:hypothetical protein
VSNAVERFWRAVAAGEVHRAISELHENVLLDWPHSGERFEGREAFLEAHLGLPAGRSVEVREIVTHGRRVAAEVRVATASGPWAVAAFYTLHDGRILHATAYWVRLP